MTEPMTQEPEIVLIVDDDEDMRMFLEHACKEIGLAAHSTENIKQAREWLSAHCPMVMIVDIMMPGGNGLDLCRWVRAQSQLERVPVIFSSAIEDKETTQDALELGAVDFLRKPYTLKTLKEKIQRLRTNHAP